MRTQSTEGINLSVCEPAGDAARGFFVYDPRDPTQKETDPRTWKPTRNPALLSAYYSAQENRVYGETLNWKFVAELADRAER